MSDNNKTFYRVKHAIFPKEGDVLHFHSINMAKAESRKLQKAGWKFKRPEGVTK